MNFENKDAYDRTRGMLVVNLMIYASLIATSILYDVFPDYLIPVSNTAYALFFASLFLIYLIYRFNLRYHYVSFNDEKGKIIVRYYPFASFNVKYLSIEIPFDSLHHIEIKKEFFKLRDELIIFQVYKGNIVPYKPIPLTALTVKEKKILIDSLNKYTIEKFDGQ